MIRERLKDPDVRDAFRDSLKSVGQVALGMCFGILGFSLVVDGRSVASVPQTVMVVGAQMDVYRDRAACVANDLDDCDRTVFVGAAARWTNTGCEVTVNYLGASDAEARARPSVWAPMVMAQTIADPCIEGRSCACGGRKL